MNIIMFLNPQYYHNFKIYNLRFVYLFVNISVKIQEQFIQKLVFHIGSI